MLSMETVDDVQSFFVRFERFDWLGKFGSRQRTTVAHSFGDAGLRIEALILHEKDDPFGSPGNARQSEQIAIVRQR